MGRQVIRQPDGLLAVLSSITDTIILWDATPDDVVDFFVDEAAGRARESAQRVVGLVAEGREREAYHQFALSWEEAILEDQAHHGEAWQQFLTGDRP